MKKIFLITLIIFIMTGLLISGGCRQSSGDDFTLSSLEGDKVSLSDFTGRIVVLNFWATWCPPCRAEIPDFVRLAGEYSSSYVQFLGVSNEDIPTLKSFASEFDINYPILVDDSNVMGKWNIGAIPTTFIIDGEGRIIDKNVGMMTGEQLKNIIEDAL